VQDAHTRLLCMQGGVSGGAIANMQGSNVVAVLVVCHCCLKQKENAEHLINTVLRLVVLQINEY